MLLKIGNESKPIKLNKIMEELVEKNVKSYKTDLTLDFNYIKKAPEVKSFIWFNKKCGTELMNEEFITVKRTYSNLVFHQFIGDKPKVYRLNVTKLCKNIYGYIEELSPHKYLKEVLTKEKDYNYANISLTTLSGKNYQLELPFDDNTFFNALVKLNLTRDNIKEYKYLSFYNSGTKTRELCS